jgi:AcrR family transcriptional regulator
MSNDGTPRRRGRPPGAWGTDTRRRILRGAQRVFSDSGFESASMAQIAGAAGISRPALVNYFDSKAAIYQACFAQVQRDALALIMSETPDGSRPAAERILGFFEAAVRYSDADDTQVRFWVTSTLDLARNAALNTRPDHQFVGLREYFTDCLERGIERGEISPAVSPAHATQMLIDLFVGLSVDIGFYGTRERTAGVLETIRVLLSGAFLAPPVAAPAEAPATARAATPAEAPAADGRAGQADRDRTAG